MKVFFGVDAPRGRSGRGMLHVALLLAGLCCAPLALAAEPPHSKPAPLKSAHPKPAHSKAPKSAHAAPAQRQTGFGSWYGAELQGRKTASGELFDMEQLTAAHPSWPLSSWVRVMNRRTGKSVVVRINDRGPFGRGRIIDLSHAAALRLGVTDHGAFPVVIERLPGKPEEVEEVEEGEGQAQHDAQELASTVTPASFASAPPAHGIE